MMAKAQGPEEPQLLGSPAVLLINLDRARLGPDVRSVAGGGVEPANRPVGGDVLPELDVLDDGQLELRRSEIEEMEIG